MLLWISFSVLTAAVLALLMAPLQRATVTSADAAEADLEVYRDQLAEIEAERERGTVPADQLEGARTEIARRLIRRADESGAESSGAALPKADARRAQSVFYAIAALIPLITVGAYIKIGMPHLPAHPFAAEQSSAAEQTSVGDLIARVEERLREQPDDGKGWEVVAPVYLRLERYGDAAHAFAQANRLLGETADRLAGFAEATLLANNGVVTEDVRRAAERMLALEAGRTDAKLWLALAKEQDGDVAGAISDYETMARNAPADAPWREPVAERIESLKARLAGGPAAGKDAEAGGAPAPEKADRGPDAEAMARAGNMSEEERSQFISRMVDGLAARLKRDGNDLPGWLKLVRAYKVMGRENDAAAALKDARQQFAGDQKSLAEIDQVAKSLGLGS